MEIATGDLQTIERDEEAFLKFFKEYAKDVYWGARQDAVIAEDRVLDAHRFWCDDMERVKKHEGLDKGLDHFKRCGHLAYWLRRCSPVVDMVDLLGAITYEDGKKLTKDQQDFRDLLEVYGNEYLAFDIAYQFCSFYEKDSGSERATTLIPESKYLQIVCQFLKAKNVSPHALFLILASLFHN